MAITFATSMLAAQTPVLSQELPKASDSAIEAIERNTKAKPEVKALLLLNFARCCVTGGDVPAVESQYMARLVGVGEEGLPQVSSSIEHPFITWAREASLQSRSGGSGALSKSIHTNTSSENCVRADKAIDAAMAHLNQCSKNAEIMNMYLVASCYSRMRGNLQNEQICSKVINDAILACEASKAIDGDQIKAAASILDSMAYGFIPIFIGDSEKQTVAKYTPADMNYFDQCEQLKLEAAALLDRLPSTDQARRKAHRDLTLWYQLLGKSEKATKEKRELFNLVGLKDDSILYPQPGPCGHFIWWIAHKESTVESKCGMG
ncbi:hypothetical protein BH11CYA1_BH11CYA1_08270 [soil metagenome]